MPKQAQFTPGPWAWYGNTDTKTVQLATVHSGRIFVMKFVRGEILVQPTPGGGYGMKPHTNFVEFEVCPEAGPNRKDPRVYRGDFHKLNHPDLALIAAAPELFEERKAISDHLGALEWATPQHAEELLHEIITKFHPSAAIKKAGGQ